MKRWKHRRMLVLSGSFGVLLLAPLLNCFFNINFIQGWYQSIGIGDLWIVSPLEGLESLLVTREPFGPLLTALVLPVVLALTLGRVFCSWVCPITFLSELLEAGKKLLRRGIAPHQHWKLLRRLLWVVLAVELLLTMILGAPLFVFLSPPGLIGRELMMLVFFHTLTLEGLIVVPVLILNLTGKRFYCRYLCPLGALLALLGSRRQIRVKNIRENCRECRVCDRACPMGLSPSAGEGLSVYCWNCGNCIDHCRFGQLRFILASDERKLQQKPQTDSCD